MNEVDVLIKVRVNLDEIGVSTVEELNGLLEDADSITMEIDIFDGDSQSLTLLQPSVEEIL